MKNLSFIFALLIVMITISACIPNKPAPEPLTPPSEDQKEAEVESGLVTEEDVTNTGEASFEAAKKELELINE